MTTRDYGRECHPPSCHSSFQNDRFSRRQRNANVDAIPTLYCSDSCELREKRLALGREPSRHLEEHSTDCLATVPSSVNFRQKCLSRSGISSTLTNVSKRSVKSKKRISDIVFVGIASSEYHRGMSTLLRYDVSWNPSRFVSSCFLWTSGKKD